MDAFLAIVAAPSIRSALHAGDAGMQLVIAAQVVAYAGVLVTGGRLGDLCGHRRILVTGLALFALGSLVAAAAPTLTTLIAARALQGMAAALMYPQTLALIHRHWQGRALTSAMAAFGVVLGLASIVGQVFGGLVLQADVLGLGWRAVFVIDAPVSAMAALVAWRLVPRSGHGRHADLDVVGSGLLTLGLASLVLPLTVGRELGWPAWTWGLFAAAGLAGAIFVRHERGLAAKGLAPLVDLTVFDIRAIRVGLLATLALYGGQLSCWLLLTLYLQDGLGLGPLATGLIFASVGVGLVVASGCTGSLRAGRERQLLSAGALGLAIAGTALGLLVLGGSVRTNPEALVLVLALIGAGFGLTIPTLVGVVVRAVPEHYEGAASGLLLTAQQVAGALGVALSGLIYFGLLPGTSYAEAFAGTLAFNVGLFLLTALLARQVR